MFLLKPKKVSDDKRKNKDNTSKPSMAAKKGPPPPPPPPPKNNEETSLKSLVKVLVIYSNLDIISDEEKNLPLSPKKRAQNLMKNFAKTFDGVSSFMKGSPKSDDEIDIPTELKKVHKDILFFLLNVTTEEFHHFFMEFYTIFDKEKNYLLSRDDFEFIINYMGSPENIGKEKLNLSLKLMISNDNVLKGAVDKLGRFFVTQGNEIVAPDILNDLFENLKDEKTWIDKGHDREYFIDFLKFLPILLSYFLEYMKRRIETRRENLMMIKGIRDDIPNKFQNEFLEEDKKQDEEVKTAYLSTKSPNSAMMRSPEQSAVTRKKPEEPKKTNLALIHNTTSLLYRFESCGFNFAKQKDTKILTYRDIEKVLILFRNSYNATMSEEQIEIILKEAQKLLKVDNYSKVEFKRKKFHTILHWMSYKIGLHCCCYDLSKKMINTPIAYLEEHVLWTCAAYSDKMDEENLKRRYQNFSDKFFGMVYSQQLEVLEAFLKKMIPNLTQGELSLISKQFDLNSSAEEITQQIYPSLMYYIEAKLKSYLKKCFFFVPIDSENLNRKNKKSGHNLFQYPTHASGVIPANKDSGLFIHSLEKIDDAENPENEQNEQNQQLSEEKVDDNVKSKFLDRFKEKYDKKPDILKSCFIMENFLEKYVYLMKHNTKNVTYSEDNSQQLEDDDKEKEKAKQSPVSKQKSIGSSHMLTEPLEKKNSRTKSSKNLKNDKSDKSDSRVPSVSLIKNKQMFMDEERERMKSAFTKREIDDAEENYVGSPEINKVRKNNTTSENKMMMRNEFSNNVNSSWYLSKEVKKSLKKQEKAYKKKRCSCKMFKIDTKACQCNVF